MSGYAECAGARVLLATVTDVDDVARRHAFHPLAVNQVVDETDDTRSRSCSTCRPTWLEVYRYRPGQFCTFRVRVDDRRALPLLLDVERPRDRRRIWP